MHIRLESLICSTLIRSFANFAQIKWATVIDSLRSPKTNDQPWANHSGHSEEMSDHERIAQVAQDKWVIVSDSLRSLILNERMSDSLKIFRLKKSKILFFSMFYTRFLILKKWAICSFPLFWWMMWANCSGCSPKIGNHEQFAQVAQREMSNCERIAQVAHQNWGN